MDKILELFVETPDKIRFHDRCTCDPARPSFKVCAVRGETDARGAIHPLRRNHRPLGQVQYPCHSPRTVRSPAYRYGDTGLRVSQRSGSTTRDLSYL
jgi:hypothetical protein